jgi:hypothetical protein
MREKSSGDWAGERAWMEVRWDVGLCGELVLGGT